MVREKLNINSKAFTLVELMTVVAIIGILAATAIPNFTKYIRKAKTSEAGINLRKIYDGEVAYFSTEKVSRLGNIISVQFVSAGPEPAVVPSNDKARGNWESAGWQALTFGVDSPVYYRYQAISRGAGSSSTFTARAEGNLDADSITSVFERIGFISNGEPFGSSGLFRANELE